jgi:hypothetical protein
VQRLIPRLRVPTVVAPTVERVSAEFAFGRSELPAVAQALRARLHDPGRAVASPDQLRRAIEEASGGTGDGAIVDVRRIPAALRSPESWEVRLMNVPATTRALVDQVISEARHVR